MVLGSTMLCHYYQKYWSVFNQSSCSKINMYFSIICKKPHVNCTFSVDVIEKSIS